MSEGLSQKHAIGKCHGMWKNKWNPKKKATLPPRKTK